MLGATIRFLVAISLTGTFVPCGISVPTRQSSQFTVITRADDKFLSSFLENPILQSFCLAPDGKKLVLLVQSGSAVNAPLWVVLEDIDTKQIAAKRKIDSGVPVIGGFSPQVAFSSDLQFIIINNLKKIQVMEVSSLKVVRTIKSPSSISGAIPLFMLASKSTNVFSFAFGDKGQPSYGLHERPVVLEFADISSGIILSEWACNDVPQSISPHGHFIAVSNEQMKGGVVGLTVYDSAGKRVVDLDGEFSFGRNSDQHRPIGRTIGLFWDEDKILLSPDENVDKAGYHSGTSLRLLEIPSGRTLQTLIPRNFGPTGEMAVSANHRVGLAVSWFFPPSMLAHEGVLPNTPPQLFLLKESSEGSLALAATMPIQELGLRASGWLEIRRPQLSADGFVLALAQRSGVEILKSTPGE